MAKVFFDISEGVWGEKVEAVKAFTDREDPQEAFERKFRVLSENWKKTFYVLCYYGIGGIGKTSFVNKLCRVIRGVEGNECRILDKIDCNYIKYDFDAKTSGIDKLSILLSLRKQLADIDQNFKFYRFDSAVLLYAKKTGGNFEKDETAQSLLESNPWMDTIVSTVGVIPVISWVSGVIQVIDKSATVIKETIGKHIDETHYRYHLNEIDGLEPSELLEKLHEYFILDMRNNMLHIATKPLVIFLDTYEKYIDTVNREISMITEDYWLRKGNKSVIRSIPGILWVITGREKLYWAEDDNWGELNVERPLDQMSEVEKEALAEEPLEQHLLGDLSLKDATDFLRQAGVHNDTLCEQLHKLTNGTPLFLDICVDTYHDLSVTGSQPVIDDFGADLTQLVSRYLSNMNENNREMAYFLACLGKWTNENVKQIAGKAETLKGYTYARYKEFVTHSFIIKNQDGSYYMHETVRRAALQNAYREIIEEISGIKLLLLKENIETDFSLNTNVTLNDYTKTLTENTYDYNAFCENLKTIKKKFISLKNSGSYELLYSSSRELFIATINRYPGTGAEIIVRSEYGYALSLKGLIKEALQVVSQIPLVQDDKEIDALDWNTIKSIVSHIYDANGMYKEAFILREQVLEAQKKILGEEHPDTLQAMNNLAVSFYRTGNKQRALILSNQVLEARKRILGEEHPDTLTAMSDLAFSYYRAGDKQKELLLREEVLGTRKRILGEEHPDTLTAISDLAFSYYRIGNRQKALVLRDQVLEARKRILGEEHPDTLKAMSDLANSYGDIGDKEKALALREQVLEVRKRILGEGHPDTLRSMSHLANSYADIGDKEKALILREQTVEAKKINLGIGHPDTIKEMIFLAGSYDDIGDREREFVLREQIRQALTRVSKSQ